MKKVLLTLALAAFIGGVSNTTFAQDGEKKNNTTEKSNKKSCNKKKSCCQKKSSCDKKKEEKENN